VTISAGWDKLCLTAIIYNANRFIVKCVFNTVFTKNRSFLHLILFDLASKGIDSALPDGEFFYCI